MLACRRRPAWNRVRGHLPSPNARIKWMPNRLAFVKLKPPAAARYSNHCPLPNIACRNICLGCNWKFRDHFLLYKPLVPIETLQIAASISGVRHSRHFVLAPSQPKNGPPLWTLDPLQRSRASLQPFGVLG